MIGKIPKEWVCTKLGEIHLDKRSSIMPNKKPGKMFELYSVPNYKIGKPEILAGKEIGSSKKIVYEDTVLLCKINPRINRVWIVGNYSQWVKIASTEWIPFFRQKGIYPKYLKCFLQKEDFRRFLSMNVSGVGGSLMRIKANTFYDYPFPLVPLPEQHKIVERIEELFTKLDAGVYALKKIKEQIKQYRQSVLKSAFEGKLTERWREENKDKLEPASALLNNLEEVKVRRNVPKVTAVSDDYQKWSIPKMWNLISVAESLRKGVLEDVKDGNHGSNHPKKNEFSREGLPFITSNLVEDFKVDYRAAPKIKGKPLERIKVGFSYPGDVILTHKGSVGRVGICEKDCVLTPQTTYYRCNKNIIKNRYLAYALASPIIQFQLSGVKSQTTRDFVSISKQYYLFFPFCLFPEQQKIVEEIEKRFSVADEVEQTVNKSLEQAEKLRQSILKKAFEGKLTEKWREQHPELVSGENSAEKLLEKIKEEKAKTETELKNKRGNKK